MALSLLSSPLGAEQNTITKIKSGSLSRRRNDFQTYGVYCTCTFKSHCASIQKLLVKSVTSSSANQKQKVLKRIIVVFFMNNKGRVNDKFSQFNHLESNCLISLVVHDSDYKQQLCYRFQSRTTEAAQLEAELNKAQKTLKAAEMLINQLDREHQRWSTQVSEYIRKIHLIADNLKMQFLQPGKCVLLPVCISPKCTFI